MKLQDCFDYFGVKAPNPRWAWSAISADGNKLALALWADAICQDGNRWVYDDRGHQHRMDSRGLNARLEHLKTALATRAAVYIVKVFAKDTLASTRSIMPGGCYPVTAHTLLITDLDDASGTFRAEIVPVDYSGTTTSENAPHAPALSTSQPH